MLALLAAKGLPEWTAYYLKSLRVMSSIIFWYSPIRTSITAIVPSLHTSFTYCRAY